MDSADGEPRRFYDGGTPDNGPYPDRAPRVLLERVATEDGEMFALHRRIAYDDRQYGEILVPADLETFRTDLTSVPALFTWLVPKTGAHLPAALVHDALLSEPEAPDYICPAHPVVTRDEADRVFRDALADAGTGLVRRWMTWSAVTTWTMLQGRGTAWPAWQRWYYRFATVLTLLVVAYLGTAATCELLDLSVPGLIAVPWIPGGALWLELLGGAAGAVVVPLLLGLTWGRFRVAGLVVGICFALLIHVTVALLALTLLYRVLEGIARRSPAALLTLGVVTLLGATLVVTLVLSGAL